MIHGAMFVLYVEKWLPFKLIVDKRGLKQQSIHCYSCSQNLTTVKTQKFIRKPNEKKKKKKTKTNKTKIYLGMKISKVERCSYKKIC